MKITEGCRSGGGGGVMTVISDQSQRHVRPCGKSWFQTRSNYNCADVCDVLYLVSMVAVVVVTSMVLYRYFMHKIINRLNLVSIQVFRNDVEKIILLNKIV